MKRTWREEIHEAIARKGWTQRETAQRCGISPSYISDILNGHRPLSVRVAVRLEMVLPVIAWKLIYLQAMDELSAEYKTATAEVRRNSAATTACNAAPET